ncbi:hypothetical protein HK097_010897 [Rhizophlyctis rosea]|uniref:RGS domain-containing protein n=1 Tax=Rhizophlyctis rosea TaxID=64517 RepID=A0AAD5SII2_9FUNG|nr:hypothetical protein HK097_010897 [Rhizophlyctis rosea]
MTESATKRLSDLLNFIEDETVQIEQLPTPPAVERYPTPSPPSSPVTPVSPVSPNARTSPLQSVTRPARSYCLSQNFSSRGGGRHGAGIVWSAKDGVGDLRMVRAVADGAAAAAAAAADRENRWERQSKGSRTSSVPELLMERVDEEDRRWGGRFPRDLHLTYSRKGFAKVMSDHEYLYNEFVEFCENIPGASTALCFSEAVEYLEERLAELLPEYRLNRPRSRTYALERFLSNSASSHPPMPQMLSVPQHHPSTRKRSHSAAPLPSFYGQTNASTSSLFSSSSQQLQHTAASNRSRTSVDLDIPSQLAPHFIRIYASYLGPHPQFDFASSVAAPYFTPSARWRTDQGIHERPLKTNVFDAAVSAALEGLFEGPYKQFYSERGILEQHYDARSSVSSEGMSARFSGGGERRPSLLSTAYAQQAIEMMHGAALKHNKHHRHPSRENEALRLHAPSPYGTSSHYENRTPVATMDPAKRHTAAEDYLDTFYAHEVQFLQPKGPPPNPHAPTNAAPPSPIRSRWSHASHSSGGRSHKTHSTSSSSMASVIHEEGNGPQVQKSRRSDSAVSVYGPNFVAAGGYILPKPRNT